MEKNVQIFLFRIRWEERGQLQGPKVLNSEWRTSSIVMLGVCVDTCTKRYNKTN